MAYPIRSRRISIAAGVLSVALAAPLVAVPSSPFAVVAAAQTSTDFNARYTTNNFWGNNEALVQGLTLEPGTKVEPTTKTAFNWGFRNEGCQLILVRPQSSLAFKSGNQEIAVRVTKTNGSTFTTTLRVNIVDAESGATDLPVEDNCPAPETTPEQPSSEQSSPDQPTTEESTPEESSAVESSPAESPVTTTEETSTEEPSPSTSNDAPTTSENTSAPVTTTEKPAEPTPVTNSDTFVPRYDTENIWDKKEAKASGLQLEPGDKVEPTTNTALNWHFRNENGALVVIRPNSSLAFRAGNVDIPVRVTPAGGTAFNTTLKLNVVNAAPQLSDEEKAALAQFDERYDTANFWKKTSVEVPELKLQPGDQIAPSDLATDFRWGVAADDQGNVTVTRPKSKLAFGSGNRDINVRVTPAEGSPFDAVLKLNVIDQREAKEWEKRLDTTYEVDFEKNVEPKPIDALELPDGVTLSKGSVAPPPGWAVNTVNGKATITPPGTFTEGFIELPVTVNDGADTFEAKLKVNARNPRTDGRDVANNAGGFLGSILGGLLGTGGLGGGGGEGGSGGRLVDIKIGADNNVIITGNANPNVEIKDNASNNGNPSVVITDNVNPRDNLSNNGNPSVVITDNVNPRDNLSNNGNPSVVITDNVNPRDNLSNNGNNNGSNNSAVVTGNANPVITNNANPNVEIKDNANPSNIGNPSVVVTDNANPNVEIKDNANPSNIGNPSVVVTDNANPRDIGNNNGSNNSAVVTGNANPNVEVKDNANPIVSDNANPQVGSSGGSSRRGGKNNDKKGEEGKDGKRGSSLIGGDVQTRGGIEDPRCIASLVGLGVPLLSLIPIALAQATNVPELNRVSVQAAKVFDDAARRVGMEPAELTALGGGVVGATIALIAVAAAATCIPRPTSIDVNIGGRTTVTTTAGATSRLSSTRDTSRLSTVVAPSNNSEPVARS